VHTPQGGTSCLLGYDQVGSLKAVAAMDGPQEGRVVKLMDYDAFGNILSDSNPNLFLPLAFAGGLRDRVTGLIRFCHGEYDPTVGRFTALGPGGDTSRTYRTGRRAVPRAASVRAARPVRLRWRISAAA